MRLAIEIDRWEDLIVLKELLNGNGLIKLNDDLPPQGWAKGNAEKEPDTKAAQQGPQTTARKTAAKPAQPPKEEQTAANGTTAAQGPTEAAGGAATDEVDPANPFAEDVKEAAKPKKLTRDGVNAAFTKYIELYGMEAARQDVSILLKEAFGDKISKISQIPGDQDSFTKAVITVADAIETNRFQREPLA